MTRLTLCPAGILIFINLLAGAAAHAQTGAGLEGLRLFLSERDRARLDKMRRDKVEDITPLVAEKPIQKQKLRSKPNPPPAPMPTVELQGFVARSNGENTIWINDVAVQTGEFVERQLRPISMDRSTGKVRIKMPNSSVIILQPGQKFEPETKN